MINPVPAGHPNAMQNARILDFSANLLEDIGCEVFSFYPKGIRDLRKLLGPGVYILKSPERVLYVGMAKNILARISDNAHASFRSAIKEAHIIQVILAKSVAHAQGLETELIQKMQPKYNVRGVDPDFKRKAEEWRKVTSSLAGKRFLADFHLELLRRLA